MGTVLRCRMASTGRPLHAERRSNWAPTQISETGLLRVAELIGIAALFLALLLSLVVLMLRARLLLRERRHRKFLSVWQPILMNAVEVASSDVPQLARRDLSSFLLLWNHLHESLLDESKDHLNQIAYALSIRSDRLEDAAATAICVNALLAMSDARPVARARRLGRIVADHAEVTMHSRRSRRRGPW